MRQLDGAMQATAPTAATVSNMTASRPTAATGGFAASGAFTAAFQQVQADVAAYIAKGDPASAGRSRRCRRAGSRAPAS